MASYLGSETTWSRWITAGRAIDGGAGDGYRSDHETSRSRTLAGEGKRVPGGFVHLAAWSRPTAGPLA